MIYVFTYNFVIFALKNKSLMKRLTFILLTILFSVAFVGGENKEACHPVPDNQPGQSSSHSQTGMDIATLAEILKDSCFELPQNGRVHTPRSEEQVQSRRPICNNKALETFASNLSFHKQSHQTQNSRKAIAASRHDRGYYIYTLRHIVI